MQVSKSKIYIAGPLFNIHERWYLEQIASALELVGYSTFLPHRDAGLLDTVDFGNRQDLFKDDIDALEQSVAVVALLTGADHDSGTCAELGFAYAREKLCFGITDDIRWINNIIWGMCGEGKHIAKNINDLIRIVQSAIPTITDRRVN